MQSISYGMDIIILVVSSKHEEDFWQKRLDAMRGQILKENTTLLTVSEDWEGGAGNALGTLYAFLKANHKMNTLYKKDLARELENGSSIGLYHTAGMGTRLAPLTGCEYNSKSRIKLVGALLKKAEVVPITLLESTLKQTSIFAPKRQGRLSVFWGDQLFIPEKEIVETSKEVDLLVKLLPSTPTKEEWENEEYSKYGLVIVDSEGSFKQLEKLSYEEFSKLELGATEKIGLSMGSFSLSKEMLLALLEEFKEELSKKEGKMDTDPHLWMPLSLPKETYLSIFKKKGKDLDFVKKHFDRMQTFKEKFKTCCLGASDLGQKTLWWDYGNMGAYYRNSLKLNENSFEGNALRSFFSTPPSPENHSESTNLKIENSVLINCSIKEGEIKNSVLINVVAHTVNLDQSVLIDTSAQKIDTKEALLYNCVENGHLSIQGNVRADMFSKDNGHIKLHNSIQSPIGWHELAEENPFSFAALHQLVQRFHPSEGQQKAQTEHSRVKQAVINFQIQEKE